jgi:hypothetical protein
MLSILVEILLADTKIYQLDLVLILVIKISDNYIVWLEVIKQISSFMHGIQFGQ